MPFSGGAFARLYSWITDAGNSVPITDTRMDGEMDGFATGLSNTICRDGQSTTTAKIPLALGASVGDGTVGTPAINWISDPDCGLYRIGTNNLGVAVNGAKVLDLSTTGLGVTGNITTTGVVAVTGMTIGRAYVEATAKADITATTPAQDDTIPLISEGTEILSVSYTVKVSTSRVRVRTTFHGVTSGAITFAGALFAGSTCLAASMKGASTAKSDMTLEAEYAPGATGAVTFSVRVGVGSGTFYLNASSSVDRAFGGASLSTIVVEEIAG
jgi:hypothetical protein